MVFTLLIEPLNTIDKPGYFVTTSHHAQEIIEQQAEIMLR